MDEERIGELLRALPRPPGAWIQAAQALPEARVALDSLVARAEASAAEREAILADLDAALRAERIEPDARNLAALRARLSRG
jgi:hypothetical protein